MASPNPAMPDQGPQRRKRVITVARKLQNREAQRAYRQRQREQRQQKNATSAPIGTRLLLPSTSRQSDLSEPRSTGLGGTSNVTSTSYEWGNGEQSSLDVLTPHNSVGESSQSVSHERDLFAGLCLGEEITNIPESDQIDALLSFSDFEAQYPSSTESLLNTNLSYQQDDLTEQPQPNTLDISQTNPILPSNISNRIYTPADPYKNTLKVTRTSLFRACMFNARCLGISVDEFFSYSCMSLSSPFYRPVSTSDDPSALIAAASHPSIPAHLQPTLPQILFPHHPLFDLIPIPTLRSRAIMLAATLPALVNTMDLKLDIVEGGLVCWGDRDRAQDGSGQPWDLRSWQAAPWFMEKWRLLWGGLSVIE